MKNVHVWETYEISNMHICKDAHEKLPVDFPQDITEFEPGRWYIITVFRYACFDERAWDVDVFVEVESKTRIKCGYFYDEDCWEVDHPSDESWALGYILQLFGVPLRRYKGLLNWYWILDDRFYLLVEKVKEDSQRYRK